MPEFQCSIVVAIRERNVAFWLITLLILLHSLGALVWQWIGVRNGRKENACQLRRDHDRAVVVLPEAQWVMPFRNIMLAECLGWLLSLLLTGIAMVQQFVSIRQCVKVEPKEGSA